MIDIQLITNEEFESKWPEIQPELVRACDNDIERKLTAGDLFAEVMQGQSGCITVRMDGELIGVAIVGATNVIYGDCLFVRAIGGRFFALWFEQLDKYLDVLCEVKGLPDGVLFNGRVGWQKQLRGLGYRAAWVTMYRGSNNG